MTEEKEKRKGHSVALSGVIGFVLVALLVGMAFGGYLGLAVIAPRFYNNQSSQNSANQNSTGDQSNNGNNGNQYSNNPNSSNNPNGSNNPTGTGDQGGGVNNNNPSPSNITSSWGGSGQFNLVINGNGNTASGTISANINCAVDQNGNTIQLAITISPTSVPQSLQQDMNAGSSVTFNFVGTDSGLQFNANAQGTIGSGSQGSSFDLNLSGSFTQSFDTLTMSITSASDSQISISNSQPIALHPN